MRDSVLAVMAILLLSCCRLPSPEELEVGDRMPSFSVTVSDGTVITGDSLSRGCALVGFFNTACPDCRVELDVLQEFWDRYSPEVSFILISREEGEYSVAAYWEAHGYDMPYAAQTGRGAYSHFSSSGIPKVYMTVDGRILAVYGDDPVATLEDLEFIVEYHRHWRGWL